MPTPRLAVLLSLGALVLACSSQEPNRGAASLNLISGNNQTGGAGTALSVVVQVNDRNGTPVSGTEVSFAVIAGGGSVTTPSVTTSSSGRASTQWTLGQTAGAVSTLTASAAGLSGSPLSFSATVIAGTATTASLVQGDGQTAGAGQALSQAVIAEFHDAFGNLVSNQLVTWTVTGGAGSIVAGSSVPDVQGRVSANWTLGYEFGGGHSLRASVGGATVSATATATIPSGSTLAIDPTANNQRGPPGQALGLPLRVMVKTSGQRGIAKVPIDWQVVSGGGNLAATPTLTDATGAGATTWTLGPGAGLQAVSAGNASLTPVTVSFSATAVVPPPSSIIGSVSVVDATVNSLQGVPRARRGAPLALGTDAIIRRPRARRAATPDYLPDVLLVKYKSGAIGALAGPVAAASVASAEAVGQAIRSRLTTHTLSGKLAITGVSPVIRLARLKVARPGDLDSVARVLASDPAVEMVGRDARVYVDQSAVHPGTVPNDAWYPVQSWHYTMLDLPRAWSTTTGSSSVIVAVIDDGIRFEHPSIGATGATYLTGGGNIRNDGYDFTSSETVRVCGGVSIDHTGDGDGYDPDPTIPDSREDSTNAAGAFVCLGPPINGGAHGMHVAGTIGAKGNDAASVLGVNWTASIRPVRVVGIGGSGSYYDMAQGVLYASGLPADNGAGGTVTVPGGLPARIINMSLGGPCLAPQFDPLRAAVVAVTNPARPNGGVLVVAAAHERAGRRGLRDSR